MSQGNSAVQWRSPCKTYAQAASAPYSTSMYKHTSMHARTIVHMTNTASSIPVHCSVVLAACHAAATNTANVWSHRFLAFFHKSLPQYCRPDAQHQTQQPCCGSTFPKYTPLVLLLQTHSNIHSSEAQPNWGDLHTSPCPTTATHPGHDKCHYLLSKPAISHAVGHSTHQLN
jgi:hypothetical protein